MLFGACRESGVCECGLCDEIQPTEERFKKFGTRGGSTGVPHNKGARVSHCHKGHEYTPENTYMSGERRGCKTCLAAKREKRKHLNDPLAYGGTINVVFGKHTTKKLVTGQTWNTKLS